jgi:hypothetical protein
MFIHLMHIYIQCITYDLLVIVEYRTAKCGIHVRDTIYYENDLTFIEFSVSRKGLK